MFTDGLVERRHRPFVVGIEQIVDLLSVMPSRLTTSQITDVLLDELSAGTAADDDIAVVAVRHVV